MNKSKKYFANMINIAAWSLIIILTSYVLIKGFYIYDTENKQGSGIGKSIVVDISEGIFNIFAPIRKHVVNYNEDNKENEKKHILTRMISEIFPIAEYVEGISEYNYATVKESYLSSAFENNEEILDKVYVENHEDEVTLVMNEMGGYEYYPEDMEEESTTKSESVETISNTVGVKYSLKSLKDYNFLLKTFYTVDRSTTVKESILDAEKLLDKNLTIKQNNAKPQILIYHTHSQEVFADSKEGKTSDSIVGVGAYLVELLENYGFKVLHNKTTFDLINGKLDRNQAYTQAGKAIPKILEANPSIEVIIDLHRDGINDSAGKLVTTINGKPTAQIMFFNGLSRNQNGDIEYLYNPYIRDNLAFSLQLQLKAAEQFPGFTRRIYLKNYRYNLHLMPRSLLVEVGAQNNTVKEAKNAMEPLATLLYELLTGK